MIYIHPRICRYKVIGLEPVLKYQPVLIQSVSVFNVFISGSAVYSDPLASKIGYT